MEKMKIGDEMDFSEIVFTLEDGREIRVLANVDGHILDWDLKKMFIQKVAKAMDAGACIHGIKTVVCNGQ